MEQGPPENNSPPPLPTRIGSKASAFHKGIEMTSILAFDVAYYYLFSFSDFLTLLFILILNLLN
jgi:hypothetical protein